MKRRPLLLALAASAALLAGCAAPPAAQAPPPHPTPPIVFVHGNGDNASLWMTTLWRFESNGWPADRLVAIDLPYPSARDDDTVAQPGRSSSAEHAVYLAAQVDEVLARTGATQVVLVGNSRGGYAIRNYVKNHGGAAKVSHAVLGGTPNHGVWAIPALRPNNEFNGAGPFLVGLNGAPGSQADETTPGVMWLTLRSDNNDKFAQPDGVWIGAKGTATNVTHDGPALRGATNVVLAERDHREVSFHEQAFGPTYTFVTGHAPATTRVRPQPRPVLDGRVLGNGTGGPNNQPLFGAVVEVYSVDALGARVGDVQHRKPVGNDGRWGPFVADSKQAYEFVIRAPGYSTTHVYRSPFARSSSVVNLRAERLADGDKDAASVLTLTRPRGYFGVPRDRIVLDGASPPAGIPSGVAGVSTAKLKLNGGVGRSVVASFESGSISERIAAVAWPAAENRVVVLELTQ